MSTKISVIDGKPFVHLDGETMTMPEAILALRSLQTEAADGLRKAETELAEAEREHGIVLAEGAEPDRDVLIAAQAVVDRSRKHIKTIEADLSSIQASSVTHETSRMVDSAAQEIERNTSIRPDLTEAYARRVAELGLQLSVTEAECGRAQAEVQGVQSRVADIEQRMSAITQRRLGGETTDADTAELTALTHDKAALGEVLDRASQAAKELDPSEARDQHGRAVADWSSHIRDAMLKALASVVQSREKGLVDALTKLAGYAHDAGAQNMGDVWRPCEQLQAFTTRTLLSALRRVA